MRRTALLITAVIVLAVGVRVRSAQQIPVNSWHYTENMREARALVRGEGWTDPFADGTGPSAHLAPLYPLLLAGVYGLCGGCEAPTVQTAQRSLSILIAVCVILILPLLARKLGLSVAGGWAAAFLAAWLPGSLWIEIMGYHEQVAASLALLGLVWSLASLQQSGWANRRVVLTTGLFLGFIALLSPNLLLVFLLFFSGEWLWRRSERRQILQSGLIIASVSLVLAAPWIVRNYVVLGGFVPLRSNLGLELAIGNRPGADGNTYAPGFNQMHPYGSAAERARLIGVGELAYMREKQQQALDWIVDNPGSFAWLTLRRIGLFWFTPDDSWCILDLKWRTKNRIYGAMGLAVLLEMWVLVRKDQAKALLLGCTLLGVCFPYFITHVEMRYRQPLVGLFALLSCDLVAKGVLWIRNKVQHPPAPPNVEYCLPQAA